MCILCKPINDPNPINVKPNSPPSLLEVGGWDSEIEREKEYRRRKELQWREETSSDGYYPPSPIYGPDDKSDPLPPCTVEEREVLDPGYHPNNYVPHNDEMPPTLVNNLVPAPEVQKTKEEGEAEYNTAKDQTINDKKKEDRQEPNQDRKRCIEETDGCDLYSESDHDNNNFLIY